MRQMPVRTKCLQSKKQHNRCRWRQTWSVCTISCAALEAAQPFLYTSTSVTSLFLLRDRLVPAKELHRSAYNLMQADVVLLLKLRSLCAPQLKAMSSYLTKLAQLQVAHANQCRVCPCMYEQCHFAVACHVESLQQPHVLLALSKAMHGLLRKPQSEQLMRQDLGCTHPALLGCVTVTFVVVNSIILAL